jgi:CDP-glucose 4,6-dehydratase
VRDYFYVEDGAAAYMLIAERLLTDGNMLRGRAYNLSNETSVTVVELVSLILSKMNSSLEPEIRNEVENEIEAQCLSAALAKEELGWRPLFTLEEGLTETIRWYRRFFGGTDNDIAGRGFAATHSRSRG